MKRKRELEWQVKVKAYKNKKVNKLLVDSTRTEISCPVKT